MKYIKTYENNSIDQPFYLTGGDKLIMSKKFVMTILPTIADFKKNYLGADIYKMYQSQIDFLDNVKVEHSGCSYYKQRILNLVMSVRWKDGSYRMNLCLYRMSDSTYYLGGQSGDSEMHGKNMIRATRECNLNFMIKLYPIVKHIKDFYKRLKGKELFFDIIKESLDDDITLAKYGVPKELEYIYGDSEDMVKNSDKYNL